MDRLAMHASCRMRIDTYGGTVALARAAGIECTKCGSETAVIRRYRRLSTLNNLLLLCTLPLGSQAIIYPCLLPLNDTLAGKPCYPKIGPQENPNSDGFQHHANRLA